MKRPPLILSATALAVAVPGTTPLGNAAGRMITSVPPLAKRAYHANVADNALKLNGHKSSTTGGAGTIPVLDAKGKLPASIGAAWALVKPNGSLGASQGITSSAKDTSGGYDITFNTDVTYCAVLATAGLKDRFTTAQVNAFGRGGNTVRVIVQDSARDYVYDTDFSVAAFC